MTSAFGGQRSIQLSYGCVVGATLLHPGPKGKQFRRIQFLVRSPLRRKGDLRSIAALALAAGAAAPLLSQ